MQVRKSLRALALTVRYKRYGNSLQIRTTVTAAERAVAIKLISTAPALSEAGFNNRLSKALLPLANNPERIAKWCIAT